MPENDTVRSELTSREEFIPIKNEKIPIPAAAVTPRNVSLLSDEEIKDMQPSDVFRYVIPFDNYYLMPS